MSFRTYDPNPVLQKLRILNTDGINEVSRPTPVKDYVPLSMETIKDTYDKHTISDYGNLTSPHSFAEIPHDPKRFRQRGKSSAVDAALSAPLNGEQRAPRRSQGLKAETQLRSSDEKAKSGDEAPENSSQVPATTPPGETQPVDGSMITGRPVYVTEEQVTEDDEHASAVILKAKWEKFARATPRRVRIPLKTAETVNT